MAAMRFEELRETWATSWAEHRGDGAKDVARIHAAGVHLDLTIRMRDGMEAIVGVVLLPGFAWVAYATPHTLSRIGAILIAVCCVVIPLRMRAARRPAPDPGLPLIETVRLERDRVRAQQRLLRTSTWWYAAPLFVGVSLFMIGPLPPGIGLLAVAFAAAVFAWLVRRNNLVLRLELDPWARELDRLADSGTQETQSTGE